MVTKAVRKTRKVKSSYDYIVAIPSYKRAETLRDKTLTVLKEYGIEPSRIHVFVANKDEKDEYEKVLEKGTYGKLLVGVPKLGPQRNYMSDYYPVGKPILHMDDDISAFIEYDTKAKRNEKPLVNLKQVIQKGFSEAAKHGLRLWGIYPTPNGYFMDDKVDTDLRYIIGCFYGMFNPGTKGEKGIKLELEGDKEDYERSIRFYIADGGVIRLRTVAPKTAYYTEKGGLQEYRTKKTILDGAQWIVKHFPDYATLNLTKKSGHPELRLRDKTKKEKEKENEKES
jgi:hypothetical protein